MVSAGGFLCGTFHKSLKTVYPELLASAERHMMKRRTPPDDRKPNCRKSCAPDEFRPWHPKFLFQRIPITLFHPKKRVRAPLAAFRGSLSYLTPSGFMPVPPCIHNICKVLSRVQVP